MGPKQSFTRAYLFTEEENKRLCFLVFFPCPNAWVHRKWNLMMTVLDQQNTTGGFNISGWYDKRVWGSLIYSPRKGNERLLSFFSFFFFFWPFPLKHFLNLKFLSEEMLKELKWTMNVQLLSDIVSIPSLPFIFVLSVCVWLMGCVQNFLLIFFFSYGWDESVDTDVWNWR